MGWGIDLGPISIGSSGVGVKPQFKLGGNVGNFSAGGGIGDVRDGLSLEAGAEVKQTFNASGNSLAQFFQNLKAKDGLADDVINPVIREMNKIISEVIRMIGIDIRTGHISGDMSVQSGVGVGGAAAFGWQDSEGYNMAGAGGKVAAGVSLSVSIFAGVKQGNKAKVIITGANFGIKMYITV